MEERKAFALPVEYDLGAIADEAGQMHHAQAQDICAGGLRIVTDYPLKKGVVLRLSLPLNGLRMPLPVFAEVAWTVPAAGRFSAGLRFLR